MSSGELIERVGITALGSLGVATESLAVFAVTPKSPYDASLSAAEQTVQLLEKADQRLADLRTSKQRLLFVMIILPDMRGYESMNAIWSRWIDPAAPPGRACISCQLAHPDMKIEMIMLAAR